MHARRSLTGTPESLARHLDAAVARSVSASLEHADELTLGDARMLLRTYERFSMTGGNRLTLTVSILAVGERMEIALTTSGGSQAVFFKINTFGEEAFLARALDALDQFART